MAFSYVSFAEVQASTSNPTTDTLSLTNTAIELLVVVVTTTGGTSRTGGNPTFAGVELIQAGTLESSDEGRVEVFYLLNDDISHSLGQTLSVPNTNTRELSVISSWYSLPTGNYAVFIDTNQGSGTSTSPSTSVGTGNITSNLVVVDGLFSGFDSDSGLQFSSNRTLIGSGDNGAEIYASSYLIGGSLGSVVMSYTLNTSDDWAIIGAAFAQISDGDLSEIDDISYFNGKVASHDGVNSDDIESIDGVLTNL